MMELNDIQCPRCHKDGTWIISDDAQIVLNPDGSKTGKWLSQCNFCGYGTIVDSQSNAYLFIAVEMKNVSEKSNNLEQARNFALHGDSSQGAMGPVQEMTNPDGSITMTLPDFPVVGGSLDIPKPVPALVDSAGQPFKQYESGAVRDTSCEHVRYDLVPTTGLKRLAMTMQEGADKYGEHTWMRGMPIGETLNHAIKHIYDYLSGNRDEDHLAHASANLFFVMHYEENKHRHGNGCGFGQR